MVETKVCLCGLCGQDVDPEGESYIESKCSLAECGKSTWHLECIREYLESGKADKRGWCNSKKVDIKKVHITNRPANHLKSRNCPVGRGKLAEGKEAQPCNGRVFESELFEVTKKKKKQVRNLEQLPPKAPLAKAAKGHAPPKPAPKPAQKAIERREPQHNRFEYYNPYHRPRKRHEREGDDESIHSSLSKASEYVFADNVTWSSEEEIEAAIVQGFLREDYRTNLCQTVAESRPCHLANRCQHAHALSELRLNAAIALDKLSPDFKTSLCEDLLMAGNCPYGISCPKAHSLEELRTLAAIQLNLLPSNFKTERCQAYDTTHTCPRGEMCSFAHGSKQLRMEAAIQAGKLTMDFKCHLCPVWWAGETCPNGDKCSKAHGLQDLRLQAAVMQKIVKEVYKSQRCTNLHCKGPMGQASCWFFHSDKDQLKPVGYKSQFCKTWKETGSCPFGEECHFVHNPKELIIDTVASKFVEKSVEGDDALSQFSNEDAVDMPGKRDVGIVPYSVLKGKMPVGVPTGKHRRKTAKGVALLLCAHFDRTGQCPDPNCRFAHGADELKRRQGRAKGGGEGTAAGAKAFNPALAPAPRKLSAVVIEAMKLHKLQAAVAILMGMGFSFPAAENAARTTGANATMAAQLLLDGGAGFNEAGVTETSVKEEMDSLCAVADSLDLATKDVEAEILRWHGDHEKAMKELQNLKLNGGKRRPPNRPPTIHEEDSNHEYLNQGWKTMQQPTWGSTEASSSSAPGSFNHFSTPALLPHNAPASIGTHSSAPQAPHEDIGVGAQSEEWEQYRPEDFGPDTAPAKSSDPEADLHAAVLASLAHTPALGPATEADHQINHNQPVTQQSEAERQNPIFSLQAPQQPETKFLPNTALSMAEESAPTTAATYAAALPSRNWFPPATDTAAFQPASTAVAALSNSLSNMHIAPLHTGSVDGPNGGLASGEVTPQPSINYDLSPQSVIPPTDAPAPAAHKVLPWLNGGTAQAKAEVPAPAPSKAADAAIGGGIEDFDSLMAMLMS